MRHVHVHCTSLHTRSTARSHDDFNAELAQALRHTWIRKKELRDKLDMSKASVVFTWTCGRVTHNGCVVHVGIAPPAAPTLTNTHTHTYPVFRPPHMSAGVSAFRK